jgi:hypothetical protein
MDLGRRNKMILIINTLTKTESWKVEQMDIHWLCVHLPLAWLD